MLPNRRRKKFHLRITDAESMKIKLKRIYEQPSADDGLRIFVDRLWPRGLTKDKAKMDIWAKEIAPSTELRRWYGHDSGKWRQFRTRYFEELDHKPEEVGQLMRHVQKGEVTLLFAAREEHLNNASALKAYIESRRSCIAAFMNNPG